MSNEVTLLLLTLGFFLAVGLLFLLTSWIRSYLDASEKLQGSLLELTQWIPDLQPMRIGTDLYCSGNLNGQRIGLRYLSGKNEQEQSFLAIRVKIRETEMDPFYLVADASINSEDSDSRGLQSGLHEMQAGLFLGTLSGVAYDELRQKYNRLSPATLASLLTLNRESAGRVTVGPDWEVNRIGRDAALRLLGQDGVALTQLELSTVIEDSSGEAIHRHIQKMCRVAGRLERELPG
ncbi:MAG TPA: hypothetical protein DEA96_05375 [Leptospiraceae bacterium]|nr:hypothetical protein [Spirochaetaceae bacterium]HBS04372.1 hypothetical protein [Leptospiraceae bacterium]|tara:strand:+ start:26845 stop:27549 length:705 start_codon:yes stop_codon:yes gene_type:complete